MWPTVYINSYVVNFIQRHGARSIEWQQIERQLNIRCRIQYVRARRTQNQMSRAEEQGFQGMNTGLSSREDNDDVGRGQTRPGCRDRP
jgi:hypothetical protein